DGTHEVTFKVYRNDCQHLYNTLHATIQSDGTATASFAPGDVGTYYWVASTAADDNNNATSGTCGDATEVSIVGPHPTTLVTHQSDADGQITVGDSVHDTATLSNAFGTPTGTITFQLYKSNNCSSPVGDPIVVNVTHGNGDYSFADLAINNVGTYY